ncbi:uncharacterized protein [Cicer arietinum]|uniref:Uncharacterized protein LOC101501503 n=1 Tax=Cicer arietinum TaxID=3827 RepID=A0A1S2Y671_CICAR|nr:uncharacterized protein LOC101501503 [Cicer arietinum]
MANAWKKDKPSRLLSLKLLFLLFSSTLLLLFLFFAFLTPHPSNPNPNFLTLNTHLFSNSISSFDCIKSPQAHPIVEGVRYPFLFSLSDFGNLPNKPHKNIVRLLKGKPFRKRDISVTIQEVLEKAKSEGTNGFVVDVGANVGMVSFAAAMGFRVLAFEPIFENLQKICEGIYFNRVGDVGANVGSVAVVGDEVKVEVSEIAREKRVGQVESFVDETVEEEVERNVEGGDGGHVDRVVKEEEIQNDFRVHD